MNEECTCLKIQIPGTETYIVPGCRIKLNRFDSVSWKVSHGWYSWGGNRPMCGWYLTQTHNRSIIKPLQKTDLDDCYLVEY